MFAFGSGVLIGTRTDIANATPINFGLVQGVTIDESATVKELFGQNQRAVATARGTIKTTGKATVARISGLAMASLFYGFVPVAGQIATAFGEAGAVPAVTTYTITVSNSATYTKDQGVISAATGIPLQKVAAGPIAGQYSVDVATGIYTFAAADASLAVLISYNYTIAATGQKFTVTNQLLGTTPTFAANFYTTFQGKAVNVGINSCTSSKFTFGTKLEDYTLPEFDFTCSADAAGNVMTWSFGEAS
jgi:hypothetical protein